MLTLALNSILSDDLPDVWEEAFRIYVIREGNTVFYVGKSEANVCDRIWGHLGEGSWGKLSGTDRLGKFIRYYASDTHNWQVDLMTVNDCVPYIEQLWPNATHDVLQAEAALIFHYRPCLNLMLNNHPNPLPEKYQRHLAEQLRISLELAKLVK